MTRSFNNNMDKSINESILMVEGSWFMAHGSGQGRLPSPWRLGASPGPHPGSGPVAPQGPESLYRLISNYSINYK